MLIIQEINEDHLVEALHLVKETFDASATLYSPEGVDSFYHFVNETNVKNHYPLVKWDYTELISITP